MSVPTHSQLMALAESWAGEAGMSLAMQGTPDEHRMLTHPDPTTRALWRCAVELADAVRRGKLDG